MMSAFHRNPTWATLWHKDMTLQDIIDDCTERLPWNLVKPGLSHKRYQKVVSKSTGKIVGYARWILPKSHRGDEVWPAALAPRVSEDVQEKYHRRFLAVDEGEGQTRGLNSDMKADLSPAIEEAEKDVIAEYGDDMMGIPTKLLCAVEARVHTDRR